VAQVELILALLVAVCVLVLAARTIRVPYPILLVVGGLVLAAIPAVPNVELAPELVFLLFLPPLLYIAGFETSIREVRAQLTPILSLAVGLVLFTIALVAVAAHALVPGLSWPLAFTLGAIVSPPDAVAATALLRGLGVPRRVVTLLEGESLFNDATALVAYQTALAAAVSSVFSPSGAALQFVWAGVGGVVVGAVVAAIVARLRPKLRDSTVEITVSLLTPWAAYLPAEQLGVSGVLATVTAGLCLGWLAPRIMDSETRVRARAVWDMVVFILNSLVFILIGLQLSTILNALTNQALPGLLGLSLATAVVLIAVRLVWVFAFWAGRFWSAQRTRKAAPANDARDTFVVGWAGMRGVVSLATALAMPLSIGERDLLIFVTFAVILVTLVGQGLTLPLIVRALGIGAASAGDGDRDELKARTAATDAAVARLEELAEEWPTHRPLIDTLRAEYDHQAGHLNDYAASLAGSSAADGSAEQELIEHRKIRRAVIDAEREAINGLRSQGAIDDQAWRRVERDLDLEELRMEA
jgi:CPA1 family monovalent cation:H+ antiporter